MCIGLCIQPKYLSSTPQLSVFLAPRRTFHEMPFKDKWIYYTSSNKIKQLETQMLLLLHNPFHLTVYPGAPFRLLRGRLYSVSHYMLFCSRACYYYLLSPIFSLLGIYIVSSPYSQCHKENLNIPHSHVQALKQEIEVNSTHLLVGDHTPTYWIFG